MSDRRIVTVNKYTAIKVSPTEFGFQSDLNIFSSHIPDFTQITQSTQEGAMPTPRPTSS